MKTMILSVVVAMGLVQSAHADLAFLQRGCDANAASGVTQITMSGVTFYQTKLQAEGANAEIMNGQAILTSRTGAKILVGNVVSESDCALDGTLTAQVALDANFKVKKTVSNETDCYAFTADGDFAIGRAYQLNLSSGAASLSLKTAYTNDYSSLSECQTAADNL